ncbi:hypothetical protein BU17DRAFT_69234 [Hysterangium stoloniferum]|nr:hypothetical protein BU17DRAFT_69234 [Hysterangium stoloniferum]
MFVSRMKAGKCEVTGLHTNVVPERHAIPNVQSDLRCIYHVSHLPTSHIRPLGRITAIVVQLNFPDRAVHREDEVWLGALAVERRKRTGFVRGSVFDQSAGSSHRGHLTELGTKKDCGYLRWKRKEGESDQKFGIFGQENSGS